MEDRKILHRNRTVKSREKTAVITSSQTLIDVENKKNCQTENKIEQNKDSGKGNSVRNPIMSKVIVVKNLMAKLTLMKGKSTTYYVLYRLMTAIQDGLVMKRCWFKILNKNVGNKYYSKFNRMFYGSGSTSISLTKELTDKKKKLEWTSLRKK